MKRYYYKHCGSLHEIGAERIFNDQGEPHDYYPLVGCPICRKICWLTDVVQIGDDDDEGQD
jgi:hypothetical protein